MGWINLAQDGGKWQAPVNMAINLNVLQNERNFLTEDFVSQEGL
jgi:hypothetical protein